MVHEWLDITPPGPWIGSSAARAGAAVQGVIAAAADVGVRLERIELQRTTLLGYVCADDDEALVAARVVLLDAAKRAVGA